MTTERLIAQIIPILVPLGLSVFCLAASLATRNHWRRRRLILTTPTTPIHQVRGGYVEIKGRVKVSASAAPLVAPWSEEPSVYFHLEILEKKGGNNAQFRTIVDDKQAQLAKIDDGTGAVQIDLRTFDLYLANDLNARSGFLNGPAPQLEALASRYGQSTQGLIFNKSMRYRLWALEVGAEVYALGTAHREDGEWVLKPEGPLALVSDRAEPLVVRRYTTRALLWALVALVAGALAAGTAYALLTPWVD